MKDEITDLIKKFDEIDKADNRTFEIALSEFEKLPPAISKSLKPVPGKRGFVIIPIGYKKEESVMKYITNAKTRERLPYQLANPADGNLTALSELLVQKRH